MNTSYSIFIVLSFIVYRTLNVTTGGSPVNGIGELTN